MDSLIDSARTDGLVVFVGAGASTLPPSLLPDWNELNRLTLSALGREIGEYIHSPGHAEDLIDRLLRRRDATDTFAPDYQAQLMVEECGDDYYRVLEALDIDVCNPCHDVIAQLASDGRVRALLTTNYDRLVEHALARHGVPHRVYSDTTGFEEFRDSRGSELPVVKIHGTVEDVASMVDTLQQRIRGRGEALDAALQGLQRDHHWLFLGYSGSDFDYNENYLGLRSGAEHGRGFTFLVEPGAAPRRSVRELMKMFDGRAASVEGTLPDWLAIFGSASTKAADHTHRDHDEAVRHLGARIEQWARSLDAMQQINIFSNLLSGADADIRSYGLMRLVWRHYRTMDDSSRPSYGRFCYRFGTSLLEHGVTPDEDWEGAIRTSTTWSAGGNESVSLPRDDAFQFLARAYDSYGLEEATPNLALAYAYTGAKQKADTALSHSLKFAGETGATRVWTDAVNAAAIIFYISKDWETGGRLLATSRSVIAWDGDEPRRARYCAWLGAYAAWRGSHDLAQDAIDEGLAISKSFGLEVTTADNLWALAILEAERGDLERSIGLFARVWRVFEANVLRPRLILTYLEATRSGLLPTGDRAARERARSVLPDMWDTVDDMIESPLLVGFLPTYSLTNFYRFWTDAMECRRIGDDDGDRRNMTGAASCLADAKRFGEALENERVVALAVGEEDEMNAELVSLGLKEG